MKVFSMKLSACFFVAVFTLFAIAGYAQNRESYKRDAIGKNGVVSSAHPLASQIGVDVLKSGGNAFDAAVATGFAVGIAEPNASGIGGGGFALLYNAKEKKSYVIDFRETAPAAAHDTFYLDKNGVPVPNKTVAGWYGSGVPGEVAGLAQLHKQFGTKTWAELMEPSIKLLENGVPVSATMNSVITDGLSFIAQSPTKAFFDKTFMKDGLPLQEGDKYYNPDLVKTLRLIQKGGADAFYKGEIATKIADAFAKNANGWITKADLANYQIKMREPVHGTYRGNYEIISIPPASSGGTIIVEILNILDNFDIRKMGYGSADAVYVMIEAQKLAFADRNQYMGDMDFVDVPVTQLMSEEFGDARAKNISMTKAGIYNPGSIRNDLRGNTTSFSVIDKDGNMITITKTINYYWGSVTVPDGTGILMNNEMDDFVQTAGHANSVAAGKRPLSSISPSIVLKDNKPYMTLGSPGATRIITAVSNIMVNMIDYDMNIQQAIEAPRFHNPNTVETLIEDRWSANMYKTLEARGEKFEIRIPIDYWMGCAQGVVILPDGSLHGGADYRCAGQAVAY